MLKFPFSLTLASFIAAVEDITTVEEPGPWAGVWDDNDQNGLTGPLSEPIAHIPNSKESKCWGIMDVPRPLSYDEDGGMPPWCEFDNDKTGSRCCSRSHDYFIKN